SALHDNIYFLLSFSKLGSGGERRWRRGDAAGSHLAADWGGPEGIATELQEIQRQVERLPSPSCLQTVGRLLQLRRQVILLQFDTAIRTLIRDSFLSSGDVASYLSVSDNMVNALPLLSNSLQRDAFSLTLPVPRPLETRGCEAQRMFPWRSFLACHGLLPLHVWDLCLSGLSSRSRLQANAAILGVSLLMEDVLNSGREAEPVCLRGQNDNDPLPRDRPHQEADEAPASRPDPVRVQSVLKGFLLLTKQLQVFKENWARARLGVHAFRTAALYQQFVKLYRTEIFFPSMRALARQMGKERDYEALISGSQSLLPPPGASEVEVKTWQVGAESFSLCVSESSNPSCVPSELWKKAPLKQSLAPERPQMVETFIQQLMEGVKFSQHHLQQCLNHLASSVMDRERQNFLFYSQFYEQILRQQTELLYHKEQVPYACADSSFSGHILLTSQFMVTRECVHSLVAWLCREMMLEISDLRTQVAHLREEGRTSEERLVLFVFEARLDGFRQQMELDVSEMVSRVRGEGVDKIIQLKNKYGCRRDDDGLLLTQCFLQKEEVHELKLEISRLSALLCKQKAVSRWRKAVELQKLHRELLQSRQVRAARGDAHFLGDRNMNIQSAVLQAARHQSAQEARSRQELDSCRAQSLEQMRTDVEDRDRRLRALSEQLDRDSRTNRLQRQRSAKQIRQVGACRTSAAKHRSVVS
uniref:Coiled-coil domain containing 162 n=1 Tax=Salarias fasciatus TaxID=181472 RepID=A0A672G9E6_SALFA